LAVADFLDHTAGEQMGGGGHLPGLFRDFARARWKTGYDGVILGHCHAPELLEEDVDDRRCTYVNLGDWVGNNTFLALENDGFSLRRYR